VFEVGETISGFDVDPVLQVYDDAPLAVKVALCPEQIPASFTVMVGLALMLTVATAELVQELLLEPITV
jgi:hypothetical protein